MRGPEEEKHLQADEAISAKLQGDLTFPAECAEGTLERARQQLQEEKEQLEEARLQMAKGQPEVSRIDNLAAEVARLKVDANAYCEVVSDPKQEAEESCYAGPCLQKSADPSSLAICSAMIRKRRRGKKASKCWRMPCETASDLLELYSRVGGSMLDDCFQRIRVNCLGVYSRTWNLRSSPTDSHFIVWQATLSQSVLSAQGGAEDLDRIPSGSSQLPLFDSMYGGPATAVKVDLEIPTSFPGQVANLTPEATTVWASVQWPDEQGIQRSVTAMMEWCFDHPQAQTIRHHKAELMEDLGYVCHPRSAEKLISRVIELAREDGIRDVDVVRALLVSSPHPCPTGGGEVLGQQQDARRVSHPHPSVAGRGEGLAQQRDARPGAYGENEKDSYNVLRLLRAVETGSTRERAIWGSALDAVVRHNPKLRARVAELRPNRPAGAFPDPGQMPAPEAAPKACANGGTSKTPLYQKQIEVLLNKITSENYKWIREQLLAINFSDPCTLRGLVDQVFEKALTEPAFCEMYAQLCFDLNQKLPVFPAILPNEAGGKPGRKEVSFRRELLNKCQDEFEKGAAAIVAAMRREKADAELKENMEVGEMNVDHASARKLLDHTAAKAERKGRMRALQNLLFIGQLYKKRMLVAKIVIECIKLLLQEHEIPKPENVECLYKLLMATGSQLDNGAAKDNMDVYFRRVKDMSSNRNLESRHRYMLQDLMNLRANKWRRSEDVEGNSQGFM